MSIETKRLLDPALGGTSVPADGYSGLEQLRALGSDWYLGQLAASGLRGRGGGAFPASMKWNAVARQPGPRHVVINGEEGEPASWKDRWLLRHRPHLVLEGALCAAQSVGAETVWFYVSDAPTAALLEKLVTDSASGFPGVVIRVILVPGTYVAGDESSAVSFISGGKALPFMKPPRPSDKGVNGQPTLVNNVETFANAALVARHGAEWFREEGTEASPGTFLACIGGDVAEPKLLEVSYGTPFPDILRHAGVDRSSIHGVLMGGYFSGFMPEALLDQPICDEALKPLGFAVGNGTFSIVAKTRCAVSVIADLLAFFSRESAGQCGVCVNGTQDMLKAAVALREGKGSQENIERLAHLGRVLMRRGACSMLDAAAMVAARAIEHFLPELEAHVGKACPKCAERPLDFAGGYAIGNVEQLLA